MKTILIKWLFKEHAAKLAAAQKDLESAGARMAQQFADFQKNEAEAKRKFMDSFDVANWIQIKLKGFDPELVKGRKVGINPRTGEAYVEGDVLDAAKAKGIPDDEFLADMAKIHKMRSFQFLVDFMNAGQILLSFFSAGSADQINFGRGLAGGQASVRGEIERLYGVFEDRHKPPEDFDAHEAL